MEDEFYLGRDYEKREAAYELKAPAQLEYTGGFSVKYAYDSSRKSPLADAVSASPHHTARNAA